MRYEADMALIRHGMTPGNEEHRYIGRTDEPLSQKGREQLLTLQKKGVYPAAACVAASPLERSPNLPLLYGDPFAQSCCTPDRRHAFSISSGRWILARLKGITMRN